MSMHGDEENTGHPLPTLLMARWIADNIAFVSGLQDRNEQLQGLDGELRERLEAAHPRIN
jgi:hypothetical protein